MAGLRAADAILKAELSGLFAGEDHLRQEHDEVSDLQSVAGTAYESDTVPQSMAGSRQRLSRLKRQRSDFEESIGSLDGMPANHIAKGSHQTRRKASQSSAGDRSLGRFDPCSDHSSKTPLEQRAGHRSASADSSGLGSSVVETDEDDRVESAESIRLPMHESLNGATSPSVDGDKDERTLFLGNIAIEAITSRSARRALLQHISAAIGGEGSFASKVETLRFRSIPFSTASMPKRAAYITQSLMSSTTKSCNAYAVLSDTAAVQRAVTSLNGSVVLGRHLRVDHAAKPAPFNYRRCVFVGNLSFVDEERPASGAAEPEEYVKDRKSRLGSATRDVEEGLWTVFSTEAGRVQNVRIIRDQQTRVGKGVAFVHFYDENAVEAALLMSGKKFPPMLPRKLRVNRCRPSSRPPPSAGMGGSEPGTRRTAGGPGQALGLGERKASHRKLHAQNRASRGGTRTAVAASRNGVFEGWRAAAARPSRTAGRHGKTAKQHKKGDMRAGRGARRAANWRERSSSKAG